MKPKLEINHSCTSCDSCRLICPDNSIFKDGEVYRIESWSCTLCQICIEVCPVDSIKIVYKEKVDLIN